MKKYTSINPLTPHFEWTKLTLALLTGGGVFGMTPIAAQTTSNWQGTVDNNFGNALNWSDAIGNISNPGSSSVVLTINSLTNSPVINDGTFFTNGVLLGSHSNYPGALTIEDRGVLNTNTFEMGYSNTGVPAAGGQLNPGQENVLIVKGAGTQFNTTGAFIIAKENATMGRVNLTQGAQANIGSLVMAQDTASSASMKVGSLSETIADGTKLTVNGNLNIGEGGMAKLEVFGAEMSVAGKTNIGYFQPGIPSSTANGELHIGHQSRVTFQSGVNLGDGNFATSLLKIDGGSQVTVDGTLFLGRMNTSNNQLLVKGVDTTLNIGALHLRSIEPGVLAQNIAKIDAAQVNITGGTLQNYIMVGNTDPTVSINGQTTALGYKQAAEMYIENGALVHLGSAERGAQLTIGANSSGNMYIKSGSVVHVHGKTGATVDILPQLKQGDSYCAPSITESSHFGGFLLPRDA